MAYIVPKLNLNRLPKNCEDYSLTCAKNIKVVDDTIVNFDGLKQAVPRTLNIVLSTTGPNVTDEQDYYYYEENEPVVNRHRRIRRQDYDVAQGELIITAITEAVSCIASVDNFYILYKIIGLNYTILDESGEEPVVRPSDITPDIKEDFENTFLNSIIILDYNKYIELNATTLGTVAYPTVYKHKRLNIIEGSVVLNSKGNTILELHQYGPDTTVPISFINLEEHNPTDIFLVNKNTGQPWWWYMDASYYTQTPIIPILNFVFKEYTKISVNSGVYSLFIRYKVFGDTYSNWISCSTPFFIGNHRKTDTQVGSFYYSDSVLLASDYTITFDIVSAFNPSNQPIEAELAYLCKTEDEEYAAKLTTLKIEQLSQSFTFVPSHATDERISINDLLEPTFNITNVKNVTYKNNEFFASNYIEESLNKGTGDFNINTPAININKVKIKEISESDDEIELPDDIEIELENYTQSYKNIGETDDYNIIYQQSDKDYTYSVNSLWLTKDFASSKDAVIKDLYDRVPPLKALPDWEGENPLEHLLNELNNYSINSKNKTYFIGNKYLGCNNAITVCKTNIGDIVKHSTINTQENWKGTLTPVVEYESRDITFNIRRSISICDIIESIKLENNKLVIKRKGQSDYDTQEYDNISFVFYEILTNYGRNENEEFVQVNTYTQTISLYKKRQEPIPVFVDDTPLLDNVTTLIPKQPYQFYVHFVKNNGFVTNGIPVSRLELKDDALDENYDNIYAYLPEFRNADYSKLDSSYVAYFYSFRKLDNYVAEGIKCKDSNITIENKDVYDVPEMDLWLYSRYGEDGNKYKPSNTLEHYKYFGNSGKYEIEENENNKNIIYLSSKKEYNKTLYRCTPYIPIDFKDFTADTILVSDYKHGLFVNGYVCKIYKAKNYPTHLEEDDTSIWIDAEYYKKEFNNVDNSVIGLNSSENSDTLNEDFVSKTPLTINGQSINETNVIALKDEDIVNIIPAEIRSVDFGQIRYSYPIYIHSNYNINFLRLREDFVYSPKNIKIKLRNSVKKNADNIYEITYETIYKGIYIYKIASNTLDNIYKTIPFYKEFNILTYAEYDYRDTNEEYNTTIRKTAPIVASNKWELPKFKSTLLYNLDTNRGLITNLVAVGKAILIHTEKGLSAFEYNPKLTTNNGEINVENTEIFDINPVDVIGSENGYGGLKDKSNSAVCFEGYMFVDITSNEILLYDDSGLKPLTKDLKYLLSYFDIIDAKLAGIQRNNVCLLCLTLKNKIDNKEYIITISYNFELERFVSIHDFKFTKAVFNSINTIFEHKTELIIHGILLRTYDYSIIDFSDIFSVIPEFAQYNREDEDYLYPIKSEEEDDIVKHNSYIDVIVVGNYEQIKVLDFINWSLIVPNDFIGAVDDDSIDNTAETSYDNDLYNQDSSLLPYQTPFKRDNAKSITIISDSARTNEIDLTDATNDKELINTNTDKVNKDSYQKPRFNCGIWSLNYFRNEYAKDVNEKTLIYGKYFIIRFVFKTKRFKFETLNINTNKYV